MTRGPRVSAAEGGGAVRLGQAGLRPDELRNGAAAERRSPWCGTRLQVDGLHVKLGQIARKEGKIKEKVLAISKGDQTIGI